MDCSTLRKAWALLDVRERRSAGFVLLIMMISALSAAVMVGSIVPFIAVLADPSTVEATPSLRWAYECFGFTSVYQFLIALGVACFAAIVAGSLLQVLRAWAVARYSYRHAHALSQRLLARYLAQPYPFFLDRNSGDMGLRVLVESRQVIAQFLRPVAELLAATLTTAAIAGLLLMLNPLIALSAFAALGGTYALIYAFTHRMLNELGRERLENNRLRHRVATDALSGIKSIKLVGRESAYAERFAGPSRAFSRAEIRIDVISQVPRFALQAIALSGVILLCLVLADSGVVRSDSDLGGFFSTLGLFVFAAQRLLPELSKLYSGLAQLQTGQALVDKLYDELVTQGQTATLPDTTPAALGLSHSLVLDQVTYTYPESERAGLHEVSLRIRAGEKIGIVGCTGSGKTTLADIILGLLEPESGRLLVDRVPISRHNQRAWMRSVGYVPQDIFLSDAPIADNIALGIAPEQIESERLERAAQTARIDQFIKDELPKGYQTHVGERGVRLSGGQRQRIGIARALYYDADLIVFDEATSALDTVTEADVMTAIDALPGNKTVLIIAHRLSTVKRCDRIVVLDMGHLVGCDTWDALMAENTAFQRIARLGDYA